MLVLKQCKGKGLLKKVIDAYKSESYTESQLTHNIFDTFKCTGERIKQKCLNKFKKFEEKKERLNQKSENVHDERRKEKIQQRID